MTNIIAPTIFTDMNIVHTTEDCSSILQPDTRPVPMNVVSVFIACTSTKTAQHALLPF